MNWLKVLLSCLSHQMMRSKTARPFLHVLSTFSFFFLKTMNMARGARLTQKQFKFITCYQHSLSSYTCSFVASEMIRFHCSDCLIHSTVIHIIVKITHTFKVCYFLKFLKILIRCRRKKYFLLLRIRF